MQQIVLFKFPVEWILLFFSSCHHEDNAALNVILKFPLTILTATSLNSAFSLDVKFDEREALF